MSETKATRERAWERKFMLTSRSGQRISPAPETTMEGDMMARSEMTRRASWMKKSA